MYNSIKAKIDNYLSNLIEKAVAKVINLDIDRDRQIEDVLSILVLINSKIDSIIKPPDRKTKVLQGKKKV